MHFELGGKNPVIVFDDADLDRALDAVVFMIYSLNGERCTSSSRLLIQRSQGAALGAGLQACPGAVQPALRGLNVIDGKLHVGGGGSFTK